MEDDFAACNSLRDISRLGDAAFDEGDPGTDRIEIGRASGAEIIEHHDLIPRSQQAFGEVRPNEPRPAGNQNFSHGIALKYKSTEMKHPGARHRTG